MNGTINDWNWKKFWIFALGVLAVVIIAGPVGYFAVEKSKIEKDAAIKQAEIQSAAQLKQAEIAAQSAIKQADIKAQADTQQTKERWEWTQRIPGFKGDAQKSD